jgi:hypothetical protein
VQQAVTVRTVLKAQLVQQEQLALQDHREEQVQQAVTVRTVLKAQ